MAKAKKEKGGKVRTARPPKPKKTKTTKPKSTPKTVSKCDIYGADNTFIRTYSRKLHGKDYKKLAKGFAKKNNYEVCEGRKRVDK